MHTEGTKTRKTFGSEFWFSSSHTSYMMAGRRFDKISLSPLFFEYYIFPCKTFNNKCWMTSKLLMQHWDFSHSRFHPYPVLSCHAFNLQDCSIPSWFHRTTRTPVNTTSTSDSTHTLPHCILTSAFQKSFLPRCKSLQMSNELNGRNIHFPILLISFLNMILFIKYFYMNDTTN